MLTGSIELQRSAFLRPLDLLRPGQTGFVYIIGTTLALSGFEGWIEAVNKEGTESVYSYKRLKSANWIVTARYPSAEAYVPMIAMRERAV